MARSYNDLGVEFKYLIVNDTDRKFGLYINTVGVQAIRPNSPYPIKDHPSGYLFNAKKRTYLTRIPITLYYKRKRNIRLRWHSRTKYWKRKPDCTISRTMAYV